MTKQELNVNNESFAKINMAKVWRLVDYFDSRPDWQKVEGAVFGLKDHKDGDLGAYGVVVKLEDGSLDFLVKEV